nr:immunoglobulin heavy chain junction region [Macaca mulatta]MOY21917.1 immunoglobulin heavy chain junction region [Macaca mulatta]MOY22620.1 immunoglobulin heavy chain junction region [Macaca mulatta]MOY23401.1 immunoglobulin heavy chain junction region [Macaca mulatta]MOY23999.1 immunoglobulin heavy chain junction region [Macaca mulatta]
CARSVGYSGYSLAGYFDYW